MAALLPLLLAMATLAVGQGSVPQWACPLEEPRLTGGASSAAVKLHVQESASKSESGEVADVDTSALETLCTDNTEFLVVFFDPNCPHCREFVLNGEPKPPIETLADELAAHDGPRVVKFNTQDSRPPADFQVQYVPTIYHSKPSTQGCQLTMFTGDQTNLELVKQFAMDGRMPATPATTAAPAGPTVIVLPSVDSRRALRAAQQGSPLKP
mmetsp:Transcript_63585/g.118203  ORF Transcript_63585/g.118203 Transcript_63585/m.118203 type:complete len:211 (+) Transcript_63585:62-694(+)